MKPPQLASLAQRLPELAFDILRAKGYTQRAARRELAELARSYRP